MLRKSMRIHYFVYRNNYICAVHATQMMVEKGSGLIVNISSFGGLRYTFNVAYGTGKSAVIPNQQLQCWGMHVVLILGNLFSFFLLCWDSIGGVSKELEMLVEQLSLDWLSVHSVLGWGGRRHSPTQQNGLSLSHHTLSVRIKASTCCFYWTVNTILLFALCWRR